MGRDYCKHVGRLLSAQRDILKTESIEKIEAAIGDVQAALASSASQDVIKEKTRLLGETAEKWLKPYPYASIRENVEVLLVALTVAMAIRTFVAQPFKIPTGSMQPTLFGVVSSSTGPVNQVNLHPLDPNFRPPGMLQRIFDFVVLGVSYHYQEAEDDGELVGVSQPYKAFFLINKQDAVIRYNSGQQKVYSFWMVPEDYFPYRAGLEPGMPVHKGQPFLNMKDSAGDHLFVDRVSYNFRHPTRGDIIVFETTGIDKLIEASTTSSGASAKGQFYIKRLVGLGGENIQIGDDRHLKIDGKRLDKTTPHFENVYSFEPSQPARDSQYSGHLNQKMSMEYGIGGFPKLFPTENDVYSIPKNHYMVMGDNTANSSDSRVWGDFAQTNVVGKYFMVYWPFSKRFGWNVR